MKMDKTAKSLFHKVKVLRRSFIKAIFQCLMLLLFLVNCFEKTKIVKQKNTRTWTSEKILLLTQFYVFFEELVWCLLSQIILRLPFISFLMISYSIIKCNMNKYDNFIANFYLTSFFLILGQIKVHFSPTTVELIFLKCCTQLDCRWQCNIQVFSGPYLIRDRFRRKKTALNASGTHCRMKSNKNDTGNNSVTTIELQQWLQHIN